MVFTEPEALSSSSPKRDGAVKLQVKLLAGSSLASAVWPWPRAKWNREAVQEPQAFSSHKVALGKLGKAGAFVGWECGGSFGAVGVELFS